MIMNPAWLKYTLRKKKCNFQTFLRGEISLFYMYSNFWVLWTILKRGLLHIVTKRIAKMKYATKFIYLHSSAKDTQLSMVRFFWDWVYFAHKKLVQISYVHGKMISV